MAGYSSFPGFNLQIHVNTLTEKVSQLQNDVDSLKKMVRLKLAEPENFCPQASEDKEKARDFPLVTNVQGANPGRKTLHLPTTVGTAVMEKTPGVANKEQNVEAKVVEKGWYPSCLPVSRHKEFAEASYSSAIADLWELDHNEPQDNVMSMAEQKDFHRFDEPTQSLLDSPNPEILFKPSLPVQAGYPQSSLESSTSEIKLLLPSKETLESSLNPKSPPFVPVSTESKVLKNVWKGSLDRSIHADRSSQILDSNNQMRISTERVSYPTLRGIESDESSTVDPETVKHWEESLERDGLRRGRGRLSKSQVMDSTSEQDSSMQVLSMPSAESLTHAASPLVSPYNSLDHTVSTQSLVLQADQSTETSHAASEGSVNMASAVPSNQEDYHLSVPVDVPVVNKKQREVGRHTGDSLVSFSRTPLETVMASKHHDSPSTIKHNLWALNKPTEVMLSEQPLTESEAFDERSIVRREAAKENARREAAKKAAQLEQVFDPFENVEIPEWRKPTFTRVLGSALDPQSKKMVLKPSITPTPPAKPPTASRPLHLLFERVIVKLRLPNGVIKTMGHLNRPPYSDADIFMHLYISENGTTSVQLVARIYSTGNDFLVLNSASTRPMLEFNIHFELPRSLDMRTITIETVPKEQQTEFAPTSPVHPEIQSLRDQLKDQLLGNLRYISFEFTEKDFTLPEIEELPHQGDHVDKTQWDGNALEFFKFIDAFRDQTRKVLTLSFTDEHPAETVDEMMTAIWRNCKPKGSLWQDHGVTWQASEDAEGHKKWRLKSHTSPPPHI